MMEKPLTGRKILITRARQQSGGFATRLGALGAEVVEFPTIEILPPVSWEELDHAIEHLSRYDWGIFTSVNGVDYFCQRLAERRGHFLFPPSLKVCAIGPATAHRLEEKGIHVDYTPTEFVAEAILRGFDRMAIKGKRFLLARVKAARDLLPEGLRKMGAQVDVVEAYRTMKPQHGSYRLKRILTEGKVDVITFTASSTVRHFAELLETKDLREQLKNITIACIGPVTARTAIGLGLKVHIQPRSYTIPALTEAIVGYFERRGGEAPEK